MLIVSIVVTFILPADQGHSLKFRAVVGGNLFPILNSSSTQVNGIDLLMMFDSFDSGDAL
jgi:hypothetical protein